jgi:hypothetical protein
MTAAAAPATPLQPPAAPPSRLRGLSGQRQPATSRATIAGQRQRPAGTGANLVLPPVLTELDTVSITAEQHEQVGSALSAMILAWSAAQATAVRSGPPVQTRAGEVPAAQPRPLPHPGVTVPSTTTEHAVVPVG